MAFDTTRTRGGLTRRGAIALGATLGVSVIGAGPALAKPQTALDAFIEAQRRSGDIPGLAVALVEAGKVRFAKGYGWADLERKRAATVDTVFPIASITKTLTAMGVMRLVEQGRLGLDEAVGPHLDFPVSNPRHPTAPITVRQLLTHTSSLSDAKYYAVDFRVPGHDASLPLGELLKSYLVPGGKHYSADDCYAAGAPGSAWDYSNIGFALLGYLVERIGGGEDFRAQMRREIFQPLGMTRSYWTQAETPAAFTPTPYDEVDGKLVAIGADAFPDYPSGMIRSSVTDFARYLAACADGGAAYGARLLSKDSMARMLTPTHPAGLPAWLSGQGVGWQMSPLGGTERANHWGGDRGVFTVAYLAPETRRGVVVLTNRSVSDPAKSAVKAIAERLLR
jgi:CubicO group peptidase (beta-lactamase class C family)